MPLTLPNLDDRNYADLVEEARKLIPTYAPTWTNHNPSDPGITLIEMFAYLTEMLIYRLNRVPDTHLIMFLKLLNGPDWQQRAGTTLNEEIRDTMLALRAHNRAVTSEDYEELAIAAAPDKIARAHCVPRSDLEQGSIRRDKPDHVSVIIVPKNEGDRSLPDEELEELKRTVREYLEPRRLLTTRVHVVGPTFVNVEVHLSLTPRPDVPEKELEVKASAAIQRYFHPLQGGPNGVGWPFGRSVYVSEIYQLLDDLSGVDFVEETAGSEEIVVRDGERILAERIIRHGETLVGALVQPHELVAIDPRLTVRRPAPV